MNDQLDLAAAQAICDRATPGPWYAIEEAHANPHRVYRVDIRGNKIEHYDVSTPVCTLHFGFAWFAGDAVFIPFARTALPAALAELATLRTEWDTFAKLMILPQPDGTERYANPADLRKYINELQDEWDTAERRLFEATNRAVAAEARLEESLAKVYASGEAAYTAVAKLCDEELDKSGAMLGRIRDKARVIHEAMHAKGAS